MPVDPTTLHVITVLFVGTLVRSILGFGEALIAVPLLALALPVEVAASINGGLVESVALGSRRMTRSKLCLVLIIGGTALAQSPAGDAVKYPPGLYAVINTSAGVITAELFEKEAPKTVRTFVGLARGTQPWLDPNTRKPVSRPLYENLIFHRVIPDFMIQTGDPTETGAHNCGFVLPDEFVASLKFDRPGRLAMANAGPGTAACQFFITEGKYSDGDGKYTIFGQVVDGQPVVTKISHVLRNDRDRPNIPTKLLNITFMRLAATAPAK